MLSLFCSLCTFLSLTEDYWGKMEIFLGGGRGVEPVQCLKQAPLKISNLKQRKRDLTQKKNPHGPLEGE